MRIGFDARNLLYPQRTGIGEYVYRLLSSLNTLDTERRIRLFFPRGEGGQTYSWDNIRSVHSVIPSDIREDRFYRLWFDVYLPLRIRSDRIDIFHGPSYLVPKSQRARTVVTVHDLTHEKYPELAQGCSAEFSKRVRESVLGADAVIAISETTKIDLLDLYPIDESRVSVIHYGVDDCFKPIEDTELLESFRKRHRLPERFVLSVGSLHPRKNIRGLLRGFSILRKKTSLPHCLVVAGKDYGGADLASEVAKVGLTESFLFLDYIPTEKLPLLYSLADAFVFPSFYEGFGLPPLEAMACGVPVVASKAGALPEVLGDAALYFDPEDAEGLAAQLEKLLNSESERGLLREAGMKRAGRYSWLECAEKTMRIYEGLA